MWPSVNIWSGSPDPLAAALTNPTALAGRKGRLRRSYVVEFAGRVFEDAEAAYQAGKRRNGDVEVAAQVIAAKFRQHPDLVRWVQARGGRAWLASCSHHTGARSLRFRWWEGDGLGSAFIRALVEGFDQAAADPSGGAPCR